MNSEYSSIDRVILLPLLDISDFIKEHREGLEWANEDYCEELEDRIKAVARWLQKIYPREEIIRNHRTSEGTSVSLSEFLPIKDLL